MDKWTEMRTAYYVAKLGTITAAAEALGIHRATVTRHIDAIEKEMEGKVFYRKASGYELTEAGEEIFRVAKVTAEQFDLVFQKAKMTSAQVTGELVITSTEIVAPLVMKVLEDYTSSNPEVKVHYKASEDVLKLEYGEADIAIRTGPKPIDDENHIQFFTNISTTLCAHKKYIKKLGLPKSSKSYKKHFFVLPQGCGGEAVFIQWLKPMIDEKKVVFTSASPSLNIKAVEQGLGIGFLPTHIADSNSQLVQLLPVKREWDVPSWLVVHRDQLRTAKVQEFLSSMS